MGRSGSVRKVKPLIDHSSGDEDAFSAEELSATEGRFSNFSSTSSSEEERRRERKKRKKKEKRRRREKMRKRKNYDDSDDVDDPSSESDGSKKRNKKKKSKYFSESSSSDSDEEPVKKRNGDKDSWKQWRSDAKKEAEEEEKRRIEQLKNSKLKIVPLTDEEIKEKYRYKKHKCAMASIATKRTISGQDVCRPGRPAELSVDKIKLHYVVHYIYRGIFDHIVPEEGENEGKIDSYVCNACNNKRFKNYLDKKEYPGRGSALCHLATDHGRLLDAMLKDDKVDVAEIEALAKYDKQFNDTYRAYLDNDDNSFGMPDDEIITVKESLVWKIYQSKGLAKEVKTEKVEVKRVEPPPIQEDMPEQSAEVLKSVLNRAKPKGIFSCPFKKELNCNFKGTEEAQAFRLHFFIHYKDKWAERLENLSKGDKCYYCDLCPIKKAIKGATDEGAKTATICHLAIQHHELRPYVEKDTRLKKEFIQDLFYDEDLKEASKIGTERSSGDKALKENNLKQNSKSPAKSPAKRKPGPKCKTRPSLRNNKKEEDEIPNFSEEESSADESGNATKRRRQASPDLLKPNTNYVRKRKKLKLTIEDLENDSEDNWEKSPAKPEKKVDDRKRVLPRRRAATKKNAYNENGESD